MGGDGGKSGGKEETEMRVRESRPEVSRRSS